MSPLSTRYAAFSKKKNGLKTVAARAKTTVQVWAWVLLHTFPEPH